MRQVEWPSAETAGTGSGGLRGRRFSAREAVEEALEARHAFAQVGHVPVEGRDIPVQVPEEPEDRDPDGEHCDVGGFHTPKGSTGGRKALVGSLGRLPGRGGLNYALRPLAALWRRYGRPGPGSGPPGCPFAGPTPIRAPGKAWCAAIVLGAAPGVAAEGGGSTATALEGETAGAVRMELREQEAALTRLVTIVEALRTVAPQRAAVDALLGDSAEGARIRAALAEIRTESRTPAATAPPQPGRRSVARTAWLPDASDLEYVQGAPPRALLRHGSGRRVTLAPGAARLVGGDRIVLEGVAVDDDGQPLAVSLTVNGRRVELEVP